jgi:hypothetical protein
MSHGRARQIASRPELTLRGAIACSSIAIVIAT